MTAKDPSRKQIIVPISNENKAKFIKESSVHITNLNRALTNIKSEVMADFVHSDQAYITTITNKVAFSLDLQMIEKYVKNVNLININKFNISWLPQSKSYLKIIGIPYLLENTNTSMSADIVESIIKSNHIFNNIVIASRPLIIKVSPKSDIAIIWLNIWDVQSSSNTKGLINRYFNIRSYIATIHRENMNPEILQCKNC